MKSKGAVICFQKYMLGHVIDNFDIHCGPICLGDYGRVDVHEVYDFRDYIGIASREDATRACGRKQLMLYQIESEYSANINLIEKSNDPNKIWGKLPFCCEDDPDNTRYGLCCCTVVNISDWFRQVTSQHPTRIAARVLYDKLTALKEEKTNFIFSIFGLWGAEDLCIITLTNSYSALSSVVATTRSCDIAAGKAHDFLFENTHSVVMLNVAHDFDGSVICWDDNNGKPVNAQISFSVKNIAGYKYLYENVYSNLFEIDTTTSIDYTSGEYDVIIRCPARLLTSKIIAGTDDKSIGLFGEHGLMSYDNEDFCNVVYQSQTSLGSFGVIAEKCHDIIDQMDLEKHRFEVLENSINTDHINEENRSAMMDAIQHVKTCILGNPKLVDQNLYFELTLNRLFKDYIRVVSGPFKSPLMVDLSVQFKTCLSAIELAGREYLSNDTRPAMEIAEYFRSAFDSIVTAMSSLINAIAQCDGLDYDEQPSFLYNTGSYSKIMCAYYGIIKKLLQLGYMGNAKNPAQKILIPILYFGITPKIFSSSFPAKCVLNSKGKSREEDALLVCIQLSYHALMDPAKYLGIMIHEIFHYIEPIHRETRNSLTTRCISRVALMEFLRLISEHRAQKRTPDFLSDESVQEIIAVVADHLANDIFKELPEMSSYDWGNLETALRNYFYIVKGEEKSVFQRYYQLFRNLRKQFLHADELDDVITYVFALNEPNVTREKEKAIFETRVQEVDSFKPLRAVIDAWIGALQEIPSDIFDLEITLCGKEPETKARQYFWQFYSLHRDMLTLSPCRNINAINSRWDISKNDIRFFAVLDHYLGRFCSDIEQDSFFNETVDNWCRNHIARPLVQVYKEFTIRNYQIYSQHSHSIASILLEFCNFTHNVVYSVLHSNTPESNDTLSIIERISKYYSNYAEVREKYHELLQHDDTDNNDAHEWLSSEIFDINKDLVEYYCHARQSLSTINRCNFFEISDEPAHITVHLPRWIREGKNKFYVAYPADLSYAIEEVTRNMSAGGTHPTLWFRGQRVAYRPTLPNIMRGTFVSSENHFGERFRKEMLLARANILPAGTELCKPEWIAVLQHNHFKTNALDFSEELYPALFFAIEKWMFELDPAKGEKPKADASISVFNPILFNMAMKLIEAENALSSCQQLSRRQKRIAIYKMQRQYDDAINSIARYCTTGELSPESSFLPLFTKDEQIEEYSPLFNWDNDSLKQVMYPRAALIPKHNPRMIRQSGQFVFYDIHSKLQERNGYFTFEHLSLNNLQERYFKLALPKVPVPLPFIIEIQINRNYWMEFVEYGRAIGLRRYHVYPEWDKLADDIIREIGL